MSLKLTFIAIVKNESKIIERCLDSLKSIVDYVVISDTGSTDNTVELIEKYLQKNNIKGKVFRDQWVNFGVNRSKSVTNGQAWLDENGIDKSKSFFLTIDADMCLGVEKKFDKNSLDKEDSWTICQINPYLKYYNTRLFRSNLLFKCSGCTHEYWGCDGVKSPDQFNDLYINDVGDGGAKNDKFIRDIFLLKQGIIDEPTNIRYFFYLAQSYNDIGDNENALIWYNKRLDAGGWNEEIFICYQRMGEVYARQGKIAEAIYHWTLGYNALPERSETLFRIINYYRLIGKNHICLMYLREALKIEYPTNLVLFIEHPVYNYKLLEELSIVAYYGKRKDLGNLACQYLLLSNNIQEETKEMANRNGSHYMCTLDWKDHKKLEFPLIENDIYKPSSSCFFTYKGGFKGIVRAVNYSITKSSSYIIRDPENKVKTKNYWINKKTGSVDYSECYELECNIPPIRDARIKGLEDLKLTWTSSDKVVGLATDFEYGKNDIPSMIIVNFKKINNKYTISSLVPTKYKNDICQKNWVPFSEHNKLYVVYSHHPLTILELDPETGYENIVIEKYSQYNLSSIRGSSIPVVLPDGSRLFLTHDIVYTDTRKYFHRFLKYSKTWELVSISLPFFIRSFFIEFSLSIMLTNDTLTVVYSTEDNTCEMVSLELEKIPWLPNDIKGYISKNI